MVNGEMVLNDIAQIVKTECLKTFEMRPDMNLTMGEFVVMPNHFHAIIGIGENEYNSPRGDARPCVSTNPTNDINPTGDMVSTNPTNDINPTGDMVSTNATNDINPTGDMVSTNATNDTSPTDDIVSTNATDGTIPHVETQGLASPPMQPMISIQPVISSPPMQPMIPVQRMKIPKTNLVPNPKIWHRSYVVLKLGSPKMPEESIPISPGNPVFTITSSEMTNHFIKF